MTIANQTISTGVSWTTDRFGSDGARRCPLPGVSEAAWSTFIQALEVQPVRAVSASGGLGAYELRPRRLVELEFATDLKYVTEDTRGHRTSVKGRRGRRAIYTCTFVSPMTQERFLANLLLQYAVFARSIARYHGELMSGAITRPEGVSLAGALAILHRGGRGALTGWPELLPETRKLYEAAQGAF